MKKKKLIINYVLTTIDLVRTVLAVSYAVTHLNGRYAVILDINTSEITLFADVHWSFRKVRQDNVPKKKNKFYKTAKITALPIRCVACISPVCVIACAKNAFLKYTKQQLIVFFFPRWLKSTASIHVPSKNSKYNVFFVFCLKFDKGKPGRQPNLIHSFDA